MLRSWGGLVDVGTEIEEGEETYNLRVFFFNRRTKGRSKRLLPLCRFAGLIVCGWKKSEN
ncbi:hypothetical protein ACEQPO_08405 [Bacillus sp. SL00103]